MRRLSVLGAALLGGFVLVAALAPWIAPYDPTAFVGEPFRPPGEGHLLGTNDAGQDLFSELVFASRVSLFFGFFVGIVGTTLAVLVGLAAASARGWVDGLLMRTVDIVLVIPFLPLLLVLAAFFGGGILTQVTVISLVIWARPARELRAQALSLRSREYVQAAVAMGASAGHVLWRHLIPGVASLIPPQFVRAAKGAILLEASLSFLGLGDPTLPGWGTMLYHASARSAFLTDAWIWWVLPPGLCLGALVLAFALLGYRLENWGRPAARRGAAGSVRGRAAGRAEDGAPRSPPLETPLPPGAPGVIEVSGLSVDYGTGPDRVQALRQVDLDVAPDQVVGIVGESGGGKTTLVQALLGLVRPPGVVASGSIRFRGTELTALGERDLRRLRGARIALVPQSGQNSLDPVMRVREQVAETMACRGAKSWAGARTRASELLAAVGIDRARHRDYPHQLSGGMRQRVLIAMALANDPDVILADEPTTGLDGPTRGEILRLLRGAAADGGRSVILVTHDLPAVVSVADRIVVIKEGEVIERGPTARLAGAPRHPYTESLLQASRADLPGRGAGAETVRPTGQTLVVTGLGKRFGNAASGVQALDGVDLEVRSGEIVGVVGPSGAGKSTLARLLFGLETPDRGTIRFDLEGDGAAGRGRTSGRGRASIRRRQLIFQDPYAALPPHLRVFDILSEPLRIYGAGGSSTEAVADILERVELKPAARYRDRYPHELSGGERQRVALGRALIPGPALVVADEPASQLDAFLRRDLVSRLARLRDEEAIAILYITHDIGLAASFCDRLVVLDRGRVVESGPTRALLADPEHPTTRALVRAWHEFGGGRAPAATPERRAHEEDREG